MCTIIIIKQEDIAINPYRNLSNHITSRLNNYDKTVDIVIKHNTNLNIEIVNENYKLKHCDHDNINNITHKSISPYDKLHAISNTLNEI